MIPAMPRPRPPHLQRERSRHGKIVWYVRVGKGPRIRLAQPYGAPGFDAEYVAAVNGEPIGKVDVCRDDEGNIHLRINDTCDEVVMKLTHHQARRVYKLLYEAVWPGEKSCHVRS